VVVEPVGRDTAPAILTAALMLEDTPDALMLVAPSDHVIPDADAFRAAVAEGAEAARTGAFVTFGVTPDRPETGYGYLELDGATDGSGAVPLKSFREKPDLETAQAMLASGGFLWNAGIFLMRVSDLIAAYRDPCPRHGRPCRAAIDTGAEDLGFFRLGAEAYGQAEAISFDYAIMERVDRVAAVPLDQRLVGSGRLGHAVAGRGARRRWQRHLGDRYAHSTVATATCARNPTGSSLWVWAWRASSPWPCPMRSSWPTSPAPRT
jgi:mannose-1-phosphate guanylyltransferase/mannose-6-phosphate isomerase